MCLEDQRSFSRRSGCSSSILAVFEWVGITYYIRGEFYREKARDYVGAAIATGVSEPVIMFRHILPNALTPVVSFAPFVIVANISSLVALDFLGFGSAGSNAQLGRADRPRHREPHEMVARVFPSGCFVSDAVCWSSSSAKLSAKRSIPKEFSPLQ